MKKILYFSIFVLSMSGCVNKHGVSMKYYSECKEYYDLQGLYHKECGKDDVFTYKEIQEAFKEKKKDPNLIEGIPSSN
jgi:hypothetical protein